jgi:hypothetical protein
MRSLNAMHNVLSASEANELIIFKTFCFCISDSSVMFPSPSRKVLHCSKIISDAPLQGCFSWCAQDGIFPIISLHYLRSNIHKYALYKYCHNSLFIYLAAANETLEVQSLNKKIANTSSKKSL